MIKVIEIFYAAESKAQCTFLIEVKNRCDLKAYVCVLVSSDGYKLVLWEGEGLSSGLIAHVLHSVFCHLHNVQARLVFMKRLQHYHLKMSV